VAINNRPCFRKGVFFRRSQDVIGLRSHVMARLLVIARFVMLGRFWAKRYVTPD